MKVEDEKLEINKKMALVKKILNNVYELLALLNPIIDQMKISKDFQHFYHDGTVKKMANTFGKISEHSREIAKYPMKNEFLNNLKN